jgi:hypothetical protein
MKTIFKSLLLMALVMGMATAAMAQTGVIRTITATARVLKPITLSAVDADVEFGGVFAGTIPFLDPKGTASAYVGFSSNIGSVVVDATAGEPIRVEFPESIVLDLTGNPPTPASIKYFPVISAYSGEATITSVNRGTSLLLASVASLVVPPLVTGLSGTGNGPFGIIMTSATAVGGGLVDRATLLIGGELSDISGIVTTPVAIDPAQPTGTYSGTFTMNLLYAL